MSAVWIVQFLPYLILASAASIDHHRPTNQKIAFNVTPGDITYYFCNQSNPGGIVVNYDNVYAARPAFDSEKETLIQIHGWLDGENSAFNDVVKEAAFSKLDINIVIADWSKVAKGEYLIVASQMPKVSEYIAAFVSNFTKTFGYPVEKIKLVGHSLGAHVSGFVGENLGGNVAQIVGLDPAGPFINKNQGHRLDKADAKFVQAIHTCDGKLGMSNAIAHADYYPNGGKNQPGCGVDIVGRCSHLRSFFFYAESLKNNGFYAQRCEDYKDFEAHKCTGAVSLMGGYNVDKDASGVYYLDTNSESPYAKGEIRFN